MASRDPGKGIQPGPAGKSPANTPELLAEIRGLIDQARSRVAIAVNAELTMLYWQVGNRMRQEVLHEARAEYGKQIVVTLSRQLVADYGNGFSEKNLRRMISLLKFFRKKILSLDCHDN